MKTNVMIVFTSIKNISQLCSLKSKQNGYDLQYVRARVHGDHWKAFVENNKICQGRGVVGQIRV